MSTDQSTPDSDDHARRARAPRAVYRRITYAYLLALGLIAAAATTVFASVHLLIAQEEESARLINMSGRQRMLSQRIALLLFEWVSAEQQGRREERRRALGENTELFRESHRALVEGAPALGLPAPESRALHELYHGDGRVSEHVAWYLEQVDALLASPAEAVLDNGDVLVQVDALSAFAQETLLPSLDDVVSQHQLESDRRVQVIRTVDIVVFTITLVGLLIEGLLIFKPMAREVARRTRELQQARDQLNHQANHDELTGLANRRYLREFADAKLPSSVPHAVLAIDLDGFKAVNDELGHAVGDRVLREVAYRLKAELREADFVARVGGDEFVVLLMEMSAITDHAHVAQRLVRRLGRSLSIAGQEVAVGASIGIARSGSDQRPFHELLNEADEALYEAKRAGKGAWRVYGVEAPPPKALFDASFPTAPPQPAPD